MRKTILIWGLAFFVSLTSFAQGSKKELKKYLKHNQQFLVENYTEFLWQTGTSFIKAYIYKDNAELITETRELIVGKWHIEKIQDVGWSIILELEGALKDEENFYEYNRLVTSRWVLVLSDGELDGSTDICNDGCTVTARFVPFQDYEF